jgi:xanthosine utilization system XapX-like protein
MAPVTAARRDNPGLGVLVGVAATVVAVFAYAGIMRAMAKDDGHYSEVGYVAIGVGLLVGAVVGKAGGRNPALPVVGLVLSVLGVFFGEIVGLSMIASHYASLGGESISWFSLLTDHFGDMFRQWKHDFDVKSFLFLALAGLEGFVIARRTGR